MIRAADDFDAINARLAELRDARQPTVCPDCEGGGWESYGTGCGDPQTKECPPCHNPEGHPSP